MPEFFPKALALCVLGGFLFSLQAQTNPSVRRLSQVIYTVQPFTEEKKVTEIRTNPDGTSTSPTETTQLSARDSQGRSFFSVTQLSNGRRSFSFDDPIAGETVKWNSGFPIAKMLKYPEAVEGRMSCWKLPPEKVDFRHDEPQFALSRVTCPPRGTHYIPYCGKRSEALPPVDDNSPPARATFDHCAQTIASMIDPGEKKVEDLGEQLIQGHAAHGCRRTSQTTMGISSYEMWDLEVGTEKHPLGLAIRTVRDDALAGGARINTIWDSTSLTLSEPDPSLFQPPQGYELKVYEMSEIPCDPPRAQPAPAH